MPAFLSKHNNAALFAVCIAVGGLLGFLLRFEVVYDLLHYHYYNGFAFANDRLDYDVAPAGIHTFFNPLADFVSWFFIRRLNTSPAVYYTLTGTVFGVLLFVCLQINRLFFKSKTAIALSLILASTGFATWFQIGTASNEIPVAVLVLTALYLMLKDEKVCFAAFLLGAATGLKLTAATYCLSSGIVFFLFNAGNFKRVALFALCGVAGFLATDGFWAYRLYSLYQNPVFPFFNAVFDSPWFAAVNFSVHDFEAPQIDKSLLSMIFLPLLLISVSKGSEPTLDHINFSDFRWLFASLLAAAYLFRRKKINLNKREKFLALWLIVSYVVWFKAFLVVRYLIPVETMLPVFFVKAGAAIKPLNGSPVASALKTTMCALVVYICVGTVWHSDSWGERREETVLPPPPTMTVPNGTLFLTGGEGNSAFLAQIAEKSDIRIVNRFENLWENYIGQTKWGDAIKSAAREDGLKAFWITGDFQIDVSKMKCARSRTDTLHTVCFPADVADGVFGGSAP